MSKEAFCVESSRRWCRLEFFCFVLYLSGKKLKVKKSLRKSKTYLEDFSFADKEAAVLNIFLGLSYIEMFRIVSF